MTFGCSRLNDGRPPLRPRALAAASPAFVRSWIRRRSNCASAEKMFRTSSPEADVVSIIPSAIDRNPISRSLRSSIMFTKWRIERPSRSRRQTTSVSPLRSSSVHAVSPDRSSRDPESLSQNRNSLATPCANRASILKVEFLLVRTYSLRTQLGVHSARKSSEAPKQMDTPEMDRHHHQCRKSGPHLKYDQRAAPDSRSAYGYERRVLLVGSGNARWSKFGGFLTYRTPYDLLGLSVKFRRFPRVRAVRVSQMERCWHSSPQQARGSPWLGSCRKSLRITFRIQMHQTPHLRYSK